MGMLLWFGILMHSMSDSKQMRFDEFMTLSNASIFA